MTRRPASRRSLTLADVTILTPALPPDVATTPLSGAEVARLLAAAEDLNLARSGHQAMVLEGVAELLRVIGDAAGGDCWQATEKSAWVLAALLDGIRSAMNGPTGTRYEITIEGAPPAIRATREAR
jgi:hypothetical protein